MEPEIPLPGGDVTEGVVRVGDTVRRPLGPHSPLVHRVLRHLGSTGFDGAPRLLGIDEAGREMLTFLDGEVAGRPWPSWVGQDDRAVSVARLLRRLDDAVEPLGLPVDLVAPPAATDGPAPTLLGHRDVTPENTVFRNGRAHALIDFDLVRPSSRCDEVENLLLWWGAWMPAQDRPPAVRDVDELTRARLLVDAYGLDAGSRAALVPVAIANAGRTWTAMRDRARMLGGGWARMWADGIGDQIRRRERWLMDNRDRLADAVRG